jgi:hypothetical protein
MVVLIMWGCNIVFGLKDLIYVASTVITIVTIWISFKNKQTDHGNRIKKIEEIIKSYQDYSPIQHIEKIEKLLFTSQGIPNIIDTRTCRENQMTIKDQIKSTDSKIDRIFDKLGEISESIVLIKYKLKIEKEDEEK